VPDRPVRSPEAPRLAIGLGSSLGDRSRALSLAVRALAAAPGMQLLRISRFVRTPPLRGGHARNWFLNGVALFRVEVDPHEVLARCVQLEQRAGRRRAVYWGDRSLDLDLLLAEGLVLHTPALQLPHPALARRPFVLGPLLEVWPDAVDPRSGLPYRDAWPAPGPRAIPWGGIDALPRLRPL
jgi:2-amino-4-hydroxy-6-hydroxymethyldihydropteridine diphosphokinase